MKLFSQYQTQTFKKALGTIKNAQSILGGQSSQFADGFDDIILQIHKGHSLVTAKLGGPSGPMIQILGAFAPDPSQFPDPEHTAFYSSQAQLHEVDTENTTQQWSPVAEELQRVDMFDYWMESRNIKAPFTGDVRVPVISTRLLPLLSAMNKLPGRHPYTVLFHSDPEEDGAVIHMSSPCIRLCMNVRGYDISTKRYGEDATEMSKFLAAGAYTPLVGAP